MYQQDAYRVDVKKLQTAKHDTTHCALSCYNSILNYNDIYDDNQNNDNHHGSDRDDLLL